MSLVMRDPLVTAGQHILAHVSIAAQDVDAEMAINTPRRYAKGMREMLDGYTKSPKEILKVEFAQEHDQVVTLDHIEFVSFCQHHLLPFFGQAHVGYIPSGKGVVGISKLARLVDCYAKRLQIQERMSSQIATALQTCLKPRGVAVVVEARHMCVCGRGVGKQHSVMRTSVMTGAFRRDADARLEFLSLVGARDAL